MPPWSHVFDDDRALADARRRARRAVIAFAVVSGALVAAAPVAAFAFGEHSAAVALACGLLLSAAAGIVALRLARENRRLWRVELSAHRFTGHDAAGRRRSLPWNRIGRLDLCGGGLSVVGLDELGRRIELRVSAGMPAFDTLARRAVVLARAHRRTICVDGCPLDAIDLAPMLDAPARPPARRERGVRE
ncbi:hypothetical protein [Rubrivirga sp. IMCC45206]|uniref:hypothetical protein n=1 Tax=Rubrivirga sp. IMCC45206 TaxID=3391614 RepID=UPI00398FD8D5